MKKYILSVMWILFGSVALATTPIYGPLQTQNNFSEITSNGTQATAEINLFGYTITLGGNFATSGANPLTLTTTGTTNVTLPTSGTLLTTAGAASIYAPLASPTFTGTVTIPTVVLSGGTIDGTAIGGTTASTGEFTNLSSSGTVSGTGFSTYLASPPIIGGTVRNVGNFTNLNSNGTLSSTGTVSGSGFSAYLASPPAIGGTAAAAGKFTTLQSTSTFTPSTTSGIVGTTLADNANAGSVGEYMSSSIAQTAISLTAATPANITSLSLTAGDWDCLANVVFDPAGTTVAVGYDGWISTTSATLPTAPNGGAFLFLSGLTYVAGAINAWPVGEIRENVSTTTTVYLSVIASFSTSTMTAGGFLGCRRVR